jgi:hypothetical protein
MNAALAPDPGRALAVYRPSLMRTETRRVSVAPGTSIEHLVRDVVDDAAMLPLLQVIVDRADGTGEPTLVPRAMWPSVRLKQDARVTLLPVPQGGGGNKLLRTVLVLAVAIAASVVFGPAGPVFGASGILPLTGTAASIASAVAITATPAASAPAVNVLLPAPVALEAA